MPYPPSMNFDLKLFAEALLSGRSLDNVIAEFGAGPDEDLPVSLIGVTDLEPLRGRKVLPTIGVCKYLAVEDELTHVIIDSMEIAIERDYGIKAPYFITSLRIEGEHPKVAHFYLDRE